MAIPTVRPRTSFLSWLTINPVRKSSGGEMAAHYSDRGRHIDSHIPYDFGDVPQPVIERAQSKYHGGRHFRYTKMEPGEGNGFFQVRVNVHGRDHTVYMDEDGRERNYDDRH
jgi:hypothetical protein